MPPTPRRGSVGSPREQYEQALSKAHRSVWWARQRAAELGLTSEEEDLHSMEQLLVVLTTLSVSGRRARKQLPGQMSLEDTQS